MIGPYRILDRIGSGGMGEVFLAHDPTLDRKVALKRVRTDHEADTDLLQRFEIEARVTALLQHPSIVPVYHFVNEEGLGTFYTMRPVEGMTLRELIDALRDGDDSVRRDWPTARLVRLFLQATYAVGYAHSRGVVHRDLKPSNIMIGPFEEVLVLDWGVADLIAQESVAVDSDEAERLEILKPTTSVRTLIGTPAYMAPEQLEDRRAGFGSDVFSLGIILYELLALRAPWSATSVRERLEEMRTAPPDPTLAQPAREIPAALSDAVLTAIAYDRATRFATIGEFSSTVANALEGRGGWRIRPESEQADNWRLAGGRVRRLDAGMELRARGNRGSLRYFCTQPFSDNACVDLEVRVKGRTGLSVWLNTRLDGHHAIEGGYCLSALRGRRRTLSLRRSGRIVAGARSPEMPRREWHHIRAERDSGHLSLHVDGQEIYSYTDPIPLTGGFVGLSAEGPGIEIRNLHVSTRGTDAQVSCLAVPDAFFNRGLFDEARAEYFGIGASHPGRNEGRVAHFRAGLCEIAMARRAEDPGIASLHLQEADACFDPDGPLADCCLVALGQARVARERRDLDSLHAALSSALRDFPDDPHLLTVGEWTLGQLHSLDADERQLLAVLLPLAIRHVRGGWGGDLVHGLARQVRNAWETPSFLTGRGRYRSGDLTSRAESELFFAFWAGHPQRIDEITRELLESGAARPHHLADAVWCLLELDQSPLARELFDMASASEDGSPLPLVQAALLAVEGELEEAAALMSQVSPSPNDRSFNSARLWLARSAWRQGESPFGPLRRVGAKDYVAREHRAWYALAEGDSARATKELLPLVERGDHRSGRNLVNFLHGAVHLSQGDVEGARAVFAHLSPDPWPRSWTLGSHLAAGTLGDGDVERYVDAAFAWETSVLASHRELLRAVGLDAPPI
jgi:serine/threonine-protein kinase